MGIYFQQSQEQGSPGETITLGFVCHNETSRLVTCALRVETSGSTLGAIPSHVDGPVRLAPGERGRGTVRVTVPDGEVSEPQDVRIRLWWSMPAVDAAVAECHLVVQPTPHSVRTTVKPEGDGTLNARLTISRNGEPTVDAEVALGREGWFLHPQHASITFHTSRGPVHIVSPSSRWLLPDLTLNSDGTVSVKLSLVNHSPVDVKASIQLNHSSGWKFSADVPQVTVQVGSGPVGITSTFRPPVGESASVGDELTVKVQVKGVPVAEATARLGKAPADARRPRRDVPALAIALPAVLIVTGILALLTRDNRGAAAANPVPAASTTTSTTQIPSTSTTVSRPTPTTRAVPRPPTTPALDQTAPPVDPEPQPEITAPVETTIPPNPRPTSVLAASANLTVSSALRRCLDSERAGGPTTTSPPSTFPASTVPGFIVPCPSQTQFRVWTVINRGPSPATTVMLTVTADVGVTVPAHETRCRSTGPNSAVCSFGTVAPQTSATVDVNFATAPSYSVKGTVSSAVPDTDPEDNTTIETQSATAPG